MLLRILRVPAIRNLSAAAAALAVAPFASGETIWANGVSKESGWVDVNKNGNNDSLLCWAASASNIIDWWQNKADAAQIPAGTPTGGDTIFNTFRTTFNNTGLGADIAWKWYFGGCDLVASNYENDFRDTSTAKTSGRYWEDYVVSTLGYTSSAAATPSYILWGNAADVSASSLYAKNLAGTLCNVFKSGAGITLAISNSSGAGHAITLWGMEYEGDVIKTIYVTDSDDGASALKEYSVAYTSTTETTGDGKDEEITTWEKTTISLQNYYGGSYTLVSWGALSLAYAIPEPSAFGLLAGTFALAFAASRRRRRTKK